VEEQERQQRALSRSADRDDSIALSNLDWPEQPEVHLALVPQLKMPRLLAFSATCQQQVSAAAAH
jgi:hypothetical protein